VLKQGFGPASRPLMWRPLPGATLKNGRIRIKFNRGWLRE